MEKDGQAFLHPPGDSPGFDNSLDLAGRRIAGGAGSCAGV
jgi:hypothetical protein